MPSILIADDHPIFRNGLSEIIRTQLEDFDVMQVSNGQEALDLLRKQPFDIAVLDVDSPRLPVCQGLCFEVELTLSQKQYYRALYEKNVKFLHKDKKKYLDSKVGGGLKKRPGF